MYEFALPDMDRWHWRWLHTLMSFHSSFIEIEFSFSKISGICFIKLWPVVTPLILPAVAARWRPTLSCPAPCHWSCAARQGGNHDYSTELTA